MAGASRGGMAKGDDALARKRGKVRRKRMRSSENAVSTRVAAIIASKRRRKTGKRRGCEGMCFSLPSPEDPFNDRHGKKKKDGASPNPDAAISDDEPPKKKLKPPPKEKAAAAAGGGRGRRKNPVAPELEAGEEKYDRPSKFLVVCLNAIRDAAAAGVDGDLVHEDASWGLEFWKCCSASPPSDVLHAGEGCAPPGLAAWLISAACDIVARKEKLGVVVPCPFLLYIVPSQERALEVRLICKPLKSLGIHSVSLHPGASVEHQISGLKSCEPEFLISTPERLLELVSRKAIDISNVSMMAIDGLKTFMDLNISDKLYSIKGAISSDAQITIFNDTCDQSAVPVVKSLLRGRITKLSVNDCSLNHRSAFIAQHIHFCPSEEKKATQVKEILEHVLDSSASKTAKVLLVAADDHEAQNLASSLKLQTCAVIDDTHRGTFTICSSKGLINVLVKGQDSLAKSDIEEFEIVVVSDLPRSIDDYKEIISGMSRHAVSGEVHVIFSNDNAALADPLADVLSKCGQMVPKFVRKLCG